MYLIFPTLGLVEDAGHGIKDADSHGDLPRTIELQCCAKDRTEGS